MTFRKYQWLAIIASLTITFGAGTAFAQRGGRGGGGGGYRAGGGGGGVSRPSYSGSGSIRYSSPSRPAAPSYSAPRAPAAAQRPAGGYTAPSYRPTSPGTVNRPIGGGAGTVNRPIAGGTVNRPIGGAPVSGSPIYRTPNTGSLVHHGTVTTPGGTTIAGAVGPRGGGAVGIAGAGGGTAGAIRGPGGAAAGGVRGPEGGAAGAVRGPGGGGAAAVAGPGGGTTGAIRGPGGAAAAGAVGPGGGTAAAVRGPAGGGAAAVRGPGGAAAGAVRGPGGYGVAGARGPYGNRVVTNLPAGAAHYPWRGHDYYHAGYGWYQPYWAGDSMYYGWVYPPVGFYYPSLPTEYSTVTVNNSTYYESEGVYYQQGEQDGQKGYVVAEAPVNPEASTGGEGENAFIILKSMCDHVAGLETFGLVANTTIDKVTAEGDKVQLSARRTMQVSRPDKFAVDVTGDNGTRQFVYDGKNISLFDGAANIYSVVEVPNTIEAALDTLARDYGAVVPLEDLMYKDLYARLESLASAGQYLGLHEVDGIKCHHLAFSTDAAECQMWIEAGDKPLLRRFTVDYKQGPRTRYAASIVEWTASPKLTAETFVFKSPAGAKQVRIEPNQKG